MSKFILAGIACLVFTGLSACTVSLDGSGLNIDNPGQQAKADVIRADADARQEANRSAQVLNRAKEVDELEQLDATQADRIAAAKTKVQAEKAWQETQRSVAQGAKTPLTIMLWVVLIALAIAAIATAIWWAFRKTVREPVRGTFDHVVKIIRELTEPHPISLPVGEVALGLANPPVAVLGLLGVPQLEPVAADHVESGQHAGATMFQAQQAQLAVKGAKDAEARATVVESFVDAARALMDRSRNATGEPEDGDDGDVIDAEVTTKTVKKPRPKGK